jgi:hypothetical protein
VLQKVKCAGRAEDADEGVEIGRGQHAAAVLLFGAVLDQGADGHDEEAAGETEGGE